MHPLSPVLHPPALEVHPFAPPRTLKGVGLWNITDVLEFPSTLMEQRTLDARGVLYEKIFSSIADVQTHNKSDHGLNDYYYGQTLHIDTDKNLYIL